MKATVHIKYTANDTKHTTDKEATATNKLKLSLQRLLRGMFAQPSGGNLRIKPEKDAVTL